MTFDETLEAELAAQRIASLLDEKALLREALAEAIDFIARHSEPWYVSGQALLTKCRHALAVSEGDV